MSFLIRILAIVAMLCPAAAWAANEWTVVRVTRDVTHSRDKSAWEPVTPGMTLPNGAWITTGPRGRLQLARGVERVSFQPGTTASIRTSGVFTRTTKIDQTAGILTLEIEKRSRPHTYVETPFLAAVVKGTIFTVTVDEKRERADIVLSRPPLNVISMTQREQLRLVFEALDGDERVRVIVLRSAGEHFSSGGDIRGFLEASPEHVSRLAWNIAAPARCSKPVIAAGRGYCFGVGFEISLACDFRLVTPTTLYALPEQKLGQIPGSGGSARLQKMVGITRTKDIVMRSRRISGVQAAEWGVATECVPDAELEGVTDALVNELRAFSPLAQRTAKKLLNDTEDSPLSIAIELEGHSYSRLRSSDDFREGVEAFHAKRRANFTGK